MSDLRALLDQADTSFAVVGATDSPGKYGGIIYRDLKRKGYRVFGINPNRTEVDGDQTWARVTDLPEKPTMLVLVVPAPRGRRVVADAVQAGVENVWVQPGAFSEDLRGDLESGGFNWLSEACVMVEAKALK